VLLGAVQLSLELAQASVGSQTPPIQLRTQQHYPVPAVAHVGLRELDLPGGAHEPNSNTAYALQPRISRTPPGLPLSGCRQTMNGWCGPMSKIASTVPPRSGSETPTSVMAIHASPACPQPQDATGARSTAHLEFDHAAHVVVRALDESRVGIDNRDEKRGHVGLEPAAAGILRESCAHRPGLDLALELGDQLGMPLRFPVHRILQPLDEAL
jgi:hypothetical protein